MKLQKYKDMAYGNPNGKIWLNELRNTELWDEWTKKLTQRKTVLGINPELYARRVLADAVWYLGYTKITFYNMRSCAHRLHRPPDRGVGEPKRDLSTSAMQKVQSLPWEIIELDDFLEYKVRPRISCFLTGPE